MNLNFISFLTFILYIISIFGYYRRLRPLKTKSVSSISPTSPKIALMIVTTLALTLHGYALYRCIDMDTTLGQNLNAANVFALMAWLTACMILVLSIHKPTENLLIFVLPLATGSLFLTYFFPSPEYFKTKENLGNLFHILTAIVSLGILAMAGFQALMLYIQHQTLRQNPKSALVHFLPPLETMETLLFQIISLGFIGLSLSLLSALLFVQESYTLPHIHKILLSFLAWALFATLLYKHQRAGWRGKTAARFTLGGLATLLLAYFSGKWILVNLG